MIKLQDIFNQAKCHGDLIYNDKTGTIRITSNSLTVWTTAKDAIIFKDE